ncbi:hypothetical protein Tco_1000250 [Tanacetum coccineum]
MDIMPFMEEGGSAPKISSLKSFVIPEETLNQEKAKKLGFPPPPVLATFGMTAKDKKRKRTEILKEVFETENIIVDGMHRNLLPPPGIEGRQGLVIREPGSRIFFYNGN